MKILPEKYTDKKKTTGLDIGNELMRRVAILVAFVSVYFFFIKLLFL